MLSFLLALALLGCLIVPCRGLSGVTQPTVTNPDPHTPACTPPGPTQAAVLKQKRDVGGDATCGFVGGASGTSFLRLGCAVWLNR